MANPPPYVDIADGEISTGVFLRPPFGRKLRDNFKNLNQRLSAQERGSRLYDQFNNCGIVDVASGAYTRSIGEVTTSQNATQIVRINRDWILSLFNAQGEDGSGDKPKPTEGVIRMGLSAGSSTCSSSLFSRLVLNYQRVTRPIVWEARLKWRNLNGGDALWGATSLPSSIVSTGFGVWVAKINSTQFRFISKDGAGSFLGTAFTQPAANTWFVARIEITDDPSARALCYLDGILKDTIVNNVPQNHDLRATALLQGTGNSGLEYDADSIEFSAQGVLDAA